MPPISDLDVPPLVTVLVPVHNNEATLASLCEQVSAAIDDTGRTHEILLVDDASTDSSWQAICTIAEADERVRGVRLAHNVGGGTAKAAGSEAATGTYICTIDADLDYRPEDLIGIIELLEAGNDFVSGVRLDDRGRPLGRKLGSRLLRRIVSRTWAFEPRDFGCGLQGWPRELATISLPYVATHRDFLWAIPLFTPARSYAEIEVTHRRGTPSSYPFSRLVARLVLLALGAWQGLAAIMVAVGASVVGGSAALAVGGGLWWLLDGPAWPALAALAIGGWVGLPLLLAGVVLARLDQVTAAATPAYVIRSVTP